jgi:hypothetical protein
MPGMLFYTYIGITLLIAVIIVSELFREKSWRLQLALALILIPLFLRIFMIK